MLHSSESSIVRGTGTSTYPNLIELISQRALCSSQMLAMNSPVRVETRHGDFSDFKIDVENGELSVSREWNRLSWHGKKGDYKVFVSMRALNSLEASSGSRAKVANIESTKLILDLSSGAFAEVAGESGKCMIDLSSGADLSAVDLTCDEANIDVSSGGHGKVSVVNRVIGDASSGGHVAVYGAPTRVSVDRSSGGRIKVVSANRHN